MKRYEGLLRPQHRGAPWPCRWVVIDTIGRPIPVVDRDGIRHTGLDSWHAIIMTMRGAENLCCEEACGSRASSAWQLLGEVAARQGTTWAISPRALFTWTLLGLWERLLTGQITVANRAPLRKPRGQDRGLGREPGMLMVGDPPSAAALRIGTDGQPLTWVCASNYGWKGSFNCSAGLDACRQLAATVAASSQALARHQLGGWAVTVGAMALRSWRRYHMEDCLYVSQDEALIDLLARAAIGGRLHCPAQPHRRAIGYYCDGRGLYASLARSERLPTRLLHVSQRGLRSELRERAGDVGAVATVSLGSALGRFPVRTETGTTYPEGRCITALCGTELSAALDGGLVDETGGYAIWHTEKPLAKFAAAALAMRAEAEQAGQAQVASLAKGLAVALVGKLHAYDERWEECQLDYNDPICGHWMGSDGRGGITEWRSVAGQVSRKRRAGLSWCAVPEIPCFLWAAGRQWLWQRLCCAGMNEVYYADTDSIICSKRGFDRLGAAGYIRENEWGALALKCGPVEVEVMGKKMVRIGDEVIHAGAPKDQRGADFAAEGYWFRAPFQGGDGPYQEAIFEEQYRERSAT